MLAAALLQAAPAEVGVPAELLVRDWPTLTVQGVRGGRFEEAPLAEAGAVAWWRASAGVRWIEAPEGSVDPGSPTPAGPVVELQPGAWIEQPIASFAGPDDAPLAQFRGHGELAVTLSGPGGERRWELSLNDASSSYVRAPVLSEGERAPAARWTLRVAVPGDAAEATVLRQIDFTVELPAPDREAMAEHLIAVAEWAFEPWLELAVDRVGPVETAFLVQDFDALDGRPLGEPKRRSTLHPIYMQLLDAQAAAPREAWGAALSAFIEDYLTLGLNSGTGLPQFYDGVADEVLPDVPMEIGLHLEFLLDVAERGPEAFRARALEAARRIGETVLRAGLLPDGNVAAKYRPSDGQALTSTVELRRLDVPAQLVRLAVAVDEERFIAPAREAVLTFEYDHRWPGTWDFIDPGFDDMYGHYGGRAATMWRSVPDDESFRQVALGGFEFFEPLWRDALRHGGNIAADQVRCWRIAIDLVRADPSLAERVRELLLEAVQIHWVGQQDGAGRWVDVTIVGFGPKALPVGDTAGVPQNQLEGLAAVIAATDVLGLEEAQVGELLARFAAVEQRSLEAFGGPFGLIPGSLRTTGGPQPAIGSLRLLGSVVLLLDALTE